MALTFGAGLLEACMLAVLNSEDTYGYKLTQQTKEMLDISESTIYPVLRRMQKTGWLEIYDQPHLGRNRRYYRITDAGKTQYETYVKQWLEYKEKVDAMLFGGGISE